MSGTSWIGRKAITNLNKYLTSNVKNSLNRTCTKSFCRHFSLNNSKNMKFVQFTYTDKPEEIRAGYVDSNKVVDLNKVDPTLAPNLIEILRNNDLDKVKK